MCSINEIRNREEQGQLQRFEIDVNSSYYDNTLKRNILKADPNKCIKAFARSAADNKLDNPEDIRTEKVR